MFWSRWLKRKKRQAPKYESFPIFAMLPRCFDGIDFDKPFPITGKLRDIDWLRVGDAKGRIVSVNGEVGIAYAHHEPLRLRASITDRRAIMAHWEITSRRLLLVSDELTIIDDVLPDGGTLTVKLTHPVIEFSTG